MSHTYIQTTTSGSQHESTSQLITKTCTIWAVAKVLQQSNKLRHCPELSLEPDMELKLPKDNVCNEAKTKAQETRVSDQFRLFVRHLFPFGYCLLCHLVGMEIINQTKLDKWVRIFLFAVAASVPEWYFKKKRNYSVF